VRIGRATVIAFLGAAILSVTSPGVGMSRADIVIDPEIRALVLAGRARVLVALKVGESGAEQRADAIARAQDRVLSHLSEPHASLVRRYASIPMLALEIDATALRTLETLTDVVTSVKLDRMLKQQ
jgi:hypothetical protein